MSISIEAIEAVLPQTQCRQCGFADCHAYACAIAEGRSPINHCAPGGAQGIAKLAQITGQPIVALDPEYGHEVPFSTARITAQHCIGCGRCVHACPVDAITGARKHLHAVLEESCTGCALCTPVCPMDCIHFVEAGRDWTPEDAQRAAHAYREHRVRLEEAPLTGLFTRPSQQEKAAVNAAVAAKIAEMRAKLGAL